MALGGQASEKSSGLNRWHIKYHLKVNEERGSVAHKVPPQTLSKVTARTTRGGVKADITVHTPPVHIAGCLTQACVVLSSRCWSSPSVTRTSIELLQFGRRTPALLLTTLLTMTRPPSRRAITQRAWPSLPYSLRGAKPGDRENRRWPGVRGGGRW